MTFADIPDSSEIFLDANTLVYHATADANYGPACQVLINRVARNEVIAYTSSHALADMAHRVMTLEAISRYAWQYKEIAARLRRHPAEVQGLSEFAQAVSDLRLFGVRVLSVDLDLIGAATAVTRQHGLLTGDALVVAVMTAQRITALASADTDFDRVPGITRFAPV